jgi:phosphoglycerol transferase MdoB-like AlkP superfamily enzyme
MFASLGRMGLTYGYMVTWLGELWYLNNAKLLERALEEARTKKFDRLTHVEYPLSIERDLVIVQMESLEFAILDYHVNGRPITPFLNQLREKSFFYKIAAMHINGSADADFTALTGLMPSPDTVTYKIKNYPYRETLARVAGKSGFATYAFHGASGYFFNRRYAFEQMGFDDFYFREELAGDFGLKVDRWGVKDHDVFDLSLKLIKEQKDIKTLHFIITLTSHGPWIFLSKDEMKIFGQPRNIKENYINSMKYLDQALSRYISDLPKDTIVVLYGDHESKIDYTKNNKGPVHPEAQEWVPCFIYKVGDDLAKKQTTRNLEISTSGELNLLDVISYLRVCINR